MGERDRTDASLHTERDKADAHFAEKFAAMEDELDDVVRTARKRADDDLAAARDHADRQLAGSADADEAQENLQRLRKQEDAVLAREHATADAVRAEERKQRREYLANFLAAERASTDADLAGERAFADALVEARDAVLAIVSHDLRSLLGGLALNAELLVSSAPEGAVGEKIRRYAGSSQRLIARMNRLISDLLDVASIEVGRLTVVPEDVEITRIVRDTLESFDPIAAARGVTLGATLPPVPLHAWLDGGRIQQVLANLISNAVKFTPEGGTITIGLWPENAEIHFVVQDTGPGIPADKLESIFGRFHQVSPDRRGLGLGLHISKGIVEAHGGRMWAESDVGAGSTFHFVLPAQ